MTIEVETLTIARLPAALGLYTALLGEKAHTTPPIVAERLKANSGIFYIAIDKATDQVVGFKFGYIDGDTCVGRGIGVLPAYRRQGIASRLLAYFAADLHARPAVHHYVFGSATDEGIPFHLASGYQPKALVQFADSAFRAKLNLAAFKIASEGYQAVYGVYQIYLELAQPEHNLAYLRRLQQEFPETDVQFVFAKAF